MSKKLIYIMFSVFMFSLLGCATGSNSYHATKIADDYVYIVDYEKISAVELAALRANRNVDVHWVNVPTKKITREEYERLLKETEQN